MPQASMLQLARTGVFGPIRLGMRHGDLERLLGTPPLWGPQSGVQRAKVWRYGDVEFHFADWQLHTIFSDHDTLSHGGPTLRIAPWLVRPGLSIAELEEELSRLQIAYTIDRPAALPGLCLVTTTAGLKFTLLDEPEDTDSSCGLIAWGLSASSVSIRGYYS